MVSSAAYTRTTPLPPVSSHSVSSGQRVVDLSLEDLVSVVRAIVREHCDVTATTAVTTSGTVLSDSASTSSVAVSWPTLLVTSTILVTLALPGPMTSSGPLDHSGGMCLHT